MSPANHPTEPESETLDAPAGEQHVRGQGPYRTAPTSLAPHAVRASGGALIVVALLFLVLAAVASESSQPRFWAVGLVLLLAGGGLTAAGGSSPRGDGPP